MDQFVIAWSYHRMIKNDQNSAHVLKLIGFPR